MLMCLFDFNTFWELQLLTYNCIYIADIKLQIKIHHNIHSILCTIIIVVYSKTLYNYIIFNPTSTQHTNVPYFTSYCYFTHRTTSHTTPHHITHHTTTHHTTPHHTTPHLTALHTTPALNSLHYTTPSNIILHSPTTPVTSDYTMSHNTTPHAIAYSPAIPANSI